MRDRDAGAPSSAAQERCEELVEPASRGGRVVIEEKLHGHAVVGGDDRSGGFRYGAQRRRRSGGGGGVHGYNALEGTFLGGCIFSGRTAGRAIADTL